MFDKILVVCVGNICRSPTAEKLLQQRLPHKQVRSAGLATNQSDLVGADMDSTARSVAAQFGYQFGEHKAQQLTSEHTRWADLILVMESTHRDEIARRYPEAVGKTMLLGSWLSNNKDIPDPYRKSTEAFEHVLQLIDKSVNSWMTRL